MESFDDVKDFISYTLDEDDEGYNDTLPFGGIDENAPDKAKKAYSAYLKKNRKLNKQGIKL